MEGLEKKIAQLTPEKQREIYNFIEYMISQEKLDQSSVDHEGFSRNDDYLEKLDQYHSYLLNLINNWDGEDALSFSAEHLNYIFDLIQKILLANISIPIPEINPIPDGSIEIRWETEEFKVVLVIPEDPSNYILYLYKNTNGNQLNGVFTSDQLIQEVVAKFSLSNE